MNEGLMPQEQLVADKIGNEAFQENLEVNPSTEYRETDDALLNLAIRAYREYAGTYTSRVCEKCCRVFGEDEFDTFTVHLCNDRGKLLATVRVVGDDAELLDTW